ncbi:hypothetical protein RJ53_00470 [Methanocalculus chunghsingensis]|uniref:Metallophosphoesterase n=2 Tax=Methanocalculus chunghsingensis TaxID=156457 RepID=A0A8J7W8F1_9EURY|nr:metallophosphoesterase family protein [Methanocalculus chunghsingensis]MBR1368047.1 hypothetical protein [Methanocalculus chunghsingensis]
MGLTNNNPDIYGPFVTGTTEKEAVISWMSNEQETFRLEYTKEPLSGSWHRQNSTVVGDGIYRVLLSDLTPATTYHYRIGTPHKISPGYQFRTFGDDEFTFIIYGDTRAQRPFFTQMERHRLVAERIASEPDLLFVIHTGDFINDHEADTDGWNEFFHVAEPYLSGTTLIPTIGNHDGPPGRFRDIFGIPEWYSVDAGGVHLIVLDSNDWAWPVMDEQTEWLRSELTGPATWRIISFHHPPHTSDRRHPGGNLAIRNQWGQLFDSHGVDMVVSAHVHAYERYIINNTQYIVIGTGGAPTYSLTEEKEDGHITSLEHTLGYLRIAVTEETMTAAFVPVARISPDNKDILEIYPEGTTFEMFTLSQESKAVEAPSGGWIAVAALLTAICIFVRTNRSEKR